MFIIEILMKQHVYYWNINETACLFTLIVVFIYSLSRKSNTDKHVDSDRCLEHKLDIVLFHMLSCYSHDGQ
jgi:hypothetical protein